MGHKVPKYPQLAIGLLVACTYSLAFGGQSQKARTGSTDIFSKLGINRNTRIASAPNFTLWDVNGNRISLSGQRGKWVFLNFWATWCGPCRAEMPSMERLHRQLAGLAVLAVNKQEDKQRVAKFMINHRLSFPSLLDSDGKVASSYRVWGLPTSFLIDDTGRVFGMRSGALDWASMEVVDALSHLILSTDPTRGSSVTADLPPSKPLPASLRVGTKPAFVYSQQDTMSELIAKLEPGEEIRPLGKDAGRGEAWYMIKSKAGVVGWLKETDVETKTKFK
jgi:thiol-disulfide isomerase/thioredoxin